MQTTINKFILSIIFILQACSYGAAMEKSENPLIPHTITIPQLGDKADTHANIKPFLEYLCTQNHTISSISLKIKGQVQIDKNVPEPLHARKLAEEKIPLNLGFSIDKYDWTSGETLKKFLKNEDYCLERWGENLERKYLWTILKKEYISEFDNFKRR